MTRWLIGSTLAISLLCAGLLGAQPGPAGAGEGRVRYTINDGWRFTLEGVEFAEKPLVSDAGWEEVTLPHTWNAHDPFDDVPSYRRGIGWYRRTLELDESLRGRRIFLHFEGANQVADVYVNGAFVGRHRGGYTAFAFDVTRHLRFGGEANLVAVKVDNSHDPFIPPLSVGFALYGGIYRDVWLVATDPVHVKVTDHASSGVYVTTPRVSRERGDVRVRGTVVNASEARRRLRVSSTVLDADGARVAEVATDVAVPAGGEAAFAQAVPPVRSPRLWSPDDPYLYTVRTEIHDGGRLLDRVENPLGFRWFRFDPAQGFFLNGEPLKLRGTNRHQDMAGFGSALSNEQHLRDLEIIKEMGANFLRLAHYPQDPAVLEAADRLGLLVWEEAPVVNYITPGEEFERNSRQMLREMIRQHHNHPSVILWGTMNEVFLWSAEGARIGRQNDTTYMRQVREFAAGMDRLAREEDPTRYSAMAIHGSEDYDLAGIAPIPEVLGLNLYSGWYGGEFEGFGRTLDRRHERYPDQVLFISEYGSGSDLRLNSTEPERFDHSSTWHRMYHESYLRQSRERAFVSGTAIWNQFDFSQPHIGESMPQMNQKGMYTFDRRPKDVYYLYRANWNPEPLVHIASRDWARRAGVAAAGTGTPAPQPVTVYSNLERVELFLDGRSLGVRTPDDVRAATWEVPFAPGENLLEARGERDGRVHADRLTIRFQSVPADLRSSGRAFEELAVNVGSNAQYADEEGPVWLADRPYTPGGFGHLGGEAKLMARDVVLTGSRRTGLLVTFREGLEGYRFDVPDGEYEVELAFAEPQRLERGARLFDVVVNGVTVRERLDLAAMGGAGRAVPVTARVRVENGAGVTVRFPAAEGAAVLNGIRIRRHR